MFAKLRAAKESEKGFTLVELLVVIIIIGILAAVAIPAFLNQRQRANDAAVQSDVKNIATQIETALVETPNAAYVTTGTGNQTGIAYFYVGDTNNTTVAVTSANDTLLVNLTSGVTVKASGNANGYLIKGFHSNGKQFASTSSYVQYESANGGLKGKTVTAW